MSKAAKTCSACSGRGRQLLMSGGDVVCSICNGTGITTTGKFLGTLPSTPNPVTDEPHEPTITTTQGDAPSVVTGNGLRYVYAPGHDSGATVTDGRDATIAEQAAEIERLRERVNGLEQLHASWADGSLAELTAERDALRLAVDHLKAERDELKTVCERYTSTLGQLTREQSELTRQRDHLRNELDGWVGATNPAMRSLVATAQTTASATAERDAASARAEKYLAVIAAQNEAIAARIQCHEAEITAAIAAHEAGLSHERGER